MRPIRRHLTYANVLVTILAFIVLTGGTAVALNGTNTVQSDDLGPGAQVQAPDVADNAVNSADIVNGSITGADIAATALSKGQKITSNCNPRSLTFVDCGTLAINLPRPGLRVLIVASAMWYSVDATNPASSQFSRGTCRIGVNGAPFGVPNGVYHLPGTVLGGSTPNRALAASATVIYGAAALFPEAAEGRQFSVVTTAAWRPTPSVRIEARWVHERFTRARDGSRFSTANIPRLKLSTSCRAPSSSGTWGSISPRTRRPSRTRARGNRS